MVRDSERSICPELIKKIIDERRHKYMQIIITSKSGYCREEKSHKHWLASTKLQFFVRINSEQMRFSIAIKIKEK